MTSKKSRVLVTGMACICAAGENPQTVFETISVGRSPISPASRLDSRALPFPFFAVADRSYPGGRRHSAYDTLNLAQYVLDDALQQAKLPARAIANAGLVMGTTAGSALHFLDAYAAYKGSVSSNGTFPALSGSHQYQIEEYFTGNLALNLKCRCQGPRITLSNACTSGADAIGMGFDLITSNRCSCVICGGADALSLVAHTGFSRLRIYSDSPCRPFDRTRQGLNLGEGAAVVVLENEAHAQKRGAEIFGSILGYASASDAHHFTAPHPEGRGLETAIRTALQRADLALDDVAFINAHGTATSENDRIEGRLLHRLLPGTPVWACKGSTGHTLGAAGALEAVLTLTALQAGLIPRSPGFSDPDPDIGLIPTKRDTHFHGRAALSTSLGFGGGNAAIVLGRV